MDPEFNGCLWQQRQLTVTEISSFGIIILPNLHDDDFTKTDFIYILGSLRIRGVQVKPGNLRSVQSLTTYCVIEGC